MAPRLCCCPAWLLCQAASSHSSHPGLQSGIIIRCPNECASFHPDTASSSLCWALLCITVLITATTPRCRCRLLEVVEKQQSAQRDAVTALCMGQHSGSVLLLVGHASGAVRIWELKTQLGGKCEACCSTGAAVSHGIRTAQPAPYHFYLPPDALPTAAAAAAVLTSWPTGGVHFALTKSLAGMHATAVTAAALLDGCVLIQLL